MVKGDKCWIIENGSRITQAEILSFSGNLCLIQLDSGATLRVPRHRLYEREESVMNVVQKMKQRHRSPHDYKQPG